MNYSCYDQYTIKNVLTLLLVSLYNITLAMRIKKSTRNADIILENLLTYAKTLEDAESQAEEIEKMSKDVEDVNFTRKSKMQNKTDEGGKETGKSGYFGRKSCQDSTQKTCFRCSGGYLHTVQCPAIGKTCNHCHKKKITSKEFADKSLGRIRVMGNR